MLNRMIQWSLANRAAVLAVSILLLALGLYTATRLPVEVLPDLTKPTVVILTEAPGLAPEEVETRVTQPLESALMGVAGLTRLRSNSDVALSLVYAEFGWGTDIYRARMMVQERLQGAREQLPEGVEPFMTPVASLMGEILLVGVRSTVPEGEAGYLPPREVRSIADWTIRRRLLSVSGIAEILNMGGGIKRIEIQPDPHRMQALGVSLAELEAAAEEAANTTTGGFLDTGPTEIMVRNLSMTVDLAEIANTAVKKIGDRAIAISDVARVEWGVEPMRGDATVSRSPEKTPTYGVIMTVTKSPGFDTRELTGKIKEALAELQPALPEGVETALLFQQKDFIDHAIGNLAEAIRDGAVMVTVVLFLFLLNLRTTFITLMAMPMSFAITMIVFLGMGISVNSMTLGGLAVAIGMVVDDAIVDVENVFRRLRENAALANPLPIGGGGQALRAHRHRHDPLDGRLLRRLTHRHPRALLLPVESKGRPRAQGRTPRPRHEMAARQDPAAPRPWPAGPRPRHRPRPACRRLLPLSHHEQGLPPEIPGGNRPRRRLREPRDLARRDEPHLRRARGADPRRA